MGFELSHSRGCLGSAVPGVLLKQAIYDHRSLTMTYTFIPESYDSVVSPTYAQEQESEGGGGWRIYLLQMAFTKIPRLSPKQPALFFLSGLIPLGSSPRC